MRPHGNRRQQEPRPDQSNGDEYSSDQPASYDETGSPEPQTDSLETVQATVRELEQQVEQERNSYLRALADYQNFKRRQEEELRQLREFANRELILGLLPIVDNFERALEAAELNKNYEALMGGVELIRRQLQDYLHKNGVQVIAAIGEQFDPNLHEAVMRVEDGDHPGNSVIQELQRGYTMHSRVLRPTMVKVSAGE